MQKKHDIALEFICEKIYDYLIKNGDIKQKKDIIHFENKVKIDFILTEKEKDSLITYKQNKYNNLDFVYSLCCNDKSKFDSLLLYILFIFGVKKENNIELEYQDNKYINIQHGLFIEYYKDLLTNTKYIFVDISYTDFLHSLLYYVYSKYDDEPNDLDNIKEIFRIYMFKKLNITKQKVGE